MSQPIIWTAGDEVGLENLQRSVAGPWSRVVDGNLSSNTGRSYTNIQDAWDAASEGDSIFVKAFDYTGGLQVNSGAGNQKDHIRIVGESSGVWSGGGGPTFGAQYAIDGCDNLLLANITVQGTAADAFRFANLASCKFVRLIAESAGVDGFESDNLTSCVLFDCHSRTNTQRGFVFYDGMTYNKVIRCTAFSNGYHGFSMGAFPNPNSESLWNEFHGCISIGSTNSGNGFGLSIGNPGSGANGWWDTILSSCLAYANTGDGFDITVLGTSTAPRLTMANCIANVNGSAGFRWTSAVASMTGCTFNGNAAFGNTGADKVGFPVTLLPGYVGNGLTAPGTNV